MGSLLYGCVNTPFCVDNDTSHGWRGLRRIDSCFEALTALRFGFWGYGTSESKIFDDWVDENEGLHQYRTHKTKGGLESD